MSSLTVQPVTLSNAEAVIPTLQVAVLVHPESANPALLLVPPCSRLTGNRVGCVAPHDLFVALVDWQPVAGATPNKIGVGTRRHERTSEATTDEYPCH
jgi:hypothetical protein